MSAREFRSYRKITDFLSYHQFDTFRGLLSGQASPEWDL